MWISCVRRLVVSQARRGGAGRGQQIRRVRAGSIQLGPGHGCLLCLTACRAWLTPILCLWVPWKPPEDRVPARDKVMVSGTWK